MVGLTFLVALASAGALGILGALLLPVQREFGWDTASISGALALRLLLFGLMAPSPPPCCSATGCGGRGRGALPRRARLPAVDGDDRALGALAVLGRADGIGSGMTALVLGATVANRWFVARRAWCWAC